MFQFFFASKRIFPKSSKSNFVSNRAMSGDGRGMLPVTRRYANCAKQCSFITKQPTEGTFKPIRSTKSGKRLSNLSSSHLLVCSRVLVQTILCKPIQINQTAFYTFFAFYSLLPACKNRSKLILFILSLKSRWMMQIVKR